MRLKRWGGLIVAILLSMALLGPAAPAGAHGCVLAVIIGPIRQYVVCEPGAPAGQGDCALNVHIGGIEEHLLCW